MGPGGLEDAGDALADAPALRRGRRGSVGPRERGVLGGRAGGHAGWA